MTASVRDDRSSRLELRWYFALVLAGGVLFYILGPLVGSLSEFTRANVPGAPLAVVVPILAALGIAARTHSLRALRERLRRPRRWWWRLLAVVGMPVLVLAGSAIVGDIPSPVSNLLGAALLAGLYFAAATAEEVGWTGFALPRLLRAHGGFVSAIIISSVWAVWHVVPYWQANISSSWIAG